MDNKAFKVFFVTLYIGGPIVDNNQTSITQKSTLTQGPVIYMYTFADGTSYIGSTHNERERYKSHTTDSSNSGVYYRMQQNMDYEYSVLSRFEFIKHLDLTDTIVKTTEQFLIDIHNPQLNISSGTGSGRKNINYTANDVKYGDIVAISSKTCRVISVFDGVMSAAESLDIKKEYIHKCLDGRAGMTDSKYFVPLKTLTDAGQGVNVGDMIDRDYLPENTIHKHQPDRGMVIQGKNHKGIQVVYLSKYDLYKRRFNHLTYSQQNDVDKYLRREDQKDINKADNTNYRYIRRHVGVRMNLRGVEGSSMICRFNNSCHLIATYADTDEVLEFVSEVKKFVDLETCLDDKVYHNDSKSFYMRLPDIAQIIKKNKKIRDFDITLYNKHMYLGLKLPVLDVKKATVVVDINTGKIDGMFDNNIELAEKYGIVSDNRNIVSKYIREKTIIQNKFQLLSYRDVMKQAGNVVRFNFIYDFHK